jgi:hypothetical protein
MFGGATIGWLVRPGARLRVPSLLAATLALGAGLARSAVVDAKMLTDPQYCAQQWVTSNIRRDAPILVLGPFSDVLDLSTHPRITSVDIELDDLSLDGPEYFVTSSLYGEERFTKFPKSLELFRNLRRGRPPFQLAAVCPVVELPVRLDFDGINSNLSKIGPEVRIYRRAH